MPVVAVDPWAEAFSDFQKLGAMDWPFSDGENITPSDTDELATVARGLVVSVAGTLRFTTRKGTVINLTVVAGQVVPYLVKKVHATGTTATVATGR